MAPSTARSQTWLRWLKLGIVQGVAAWSAYAVVEFLMSSVLFRVARPYARFTAWHWELTAQLALSYLLGGMLVGAAAALLIFPLRQRRFLNGRSTGLVLEHAALMALFLAVALYLVRAPALSAGWWKLLLVPAAMAAILGLALFSETWSARFGLLTNPWVASAWFLGFGLTYELEEMGVAGQMGVPLRLWRLLLLGLLSVAAGAAIWAGRWIHEGSRPLRAANWAGTGLTAALAVASFALGAERPPEPPAAAIAGSSDRPNVVLVVMDTVRADHLSLYGYGRDTTPNLKKLAADAVVYRQALSAADITLTSHASIFTGLYPSWHGAFCQPPEASFGRRIGPAPTMAETLSRNGYHSIGVGGNLYLRADFGLQRGFARFRIPRPVPILAAENWYMLRNGMRHAIGLFTDTAQYDRLYSRADAINGAFFDLLSDRALAKAPFFAFLNYMDAHFPYIPPRPFDRYFSQTSASYSSGDLETMQNRVNADAAPVPPAYTEYAVSHYDGGIAFIDAQIGQMVGWLKQQNLYDNTLIVVTADHGEAFGERRLFEHGNSLYANLLHVPLLIKYPHSAVTGSVNAAVSLIDIFPTVLGVAGVPAPSGLQGRDLRGGKASEPRRLYSESFPCPVLHQPECPHGCTMRTIVSWPDKYIWSSNGRLETYQLAHDPHETHNLFGSLNPTAQALAAELRAWGKTIPEQKREYVNLSPEEVTRFRSLGYIQ